MTSSERGVTVGPNRRIRLQRTKGWRKPEDAVVVSRPSRWANPFRIGFDGERGECISLYRRALLNGELPFSVADVRKELAGRVLACWCHPNEECHADVLLEIADGGPIPAATSPGSRRRGGR